jgi:hypothetical protein
MGARGGGLLPHGGREMGEGPGHGGQQGGAKDMAVNGLQPSSVVRQRCCANKGERRGYAIDRWGLAATGSGGKRRGYVREKIGAAQRWSADRRARSTRCWATV